MQQELIHDLAKKIDLANLKSNVDKLLKGSNRRGVWNSRGGWKIYQNLIVRGGGGLERYGRLERTENFNSKGDGGQLLNFFFLSFSNHENYPIKKICVRSKSKVKTKVTSKQNLEYFNMINRRLLIYKLCNDSKMLLSSPWAMFISGLCFCPHQGPTFLRLSNCFSFPLIFPFIIIQYIRVKTE